MLRSYSLHNGLTFIFFGAIGGVGALLRSRGLFNYQKNALVEVCFCLERCGITCRNRKRLRFFRYGEGRVCHCHNWDRLQEIPKGASPPGVQKLQ